MRERGRARGKQEKGIEAEIGRMRDRHRKISRQKKRKILNVDIC